MEHFVSLWLFTFASQTAVGMVLVKSILLMTGRMSGEDIKAVNLQKVISLLLLFSLATAFFHLGRPLRAVHALNNIASSPLSMEIASLSLFVAAALTGLWFLHRGTVNLLTRLLPVIEVTAGLLLLLTMTAVYMLPSVPAWFTSRTPLAFVLTVVAAGSASTALSVAGRQAQLARLLTATGSVAVLLLAALGAKTGFALSGAGGVFFFTQVMAAVGGFVLLSLISGTGDLNKSRRMTVTTAILVLLSGFIARLLFFLSYDNTIL